MPATGENLERNTVTQIAFGPGDSALIFIDTLAPFGPAWVFSTDNVNIKQLQFRSARVVIDVGLGINSDFELRADNTVFKRQADSRPWLDASLTEVVFGRDIHHYGDLPFEFHSSIAGVSIVRIDGNNHLTTINGDVVIDPEDSGNWAGAVAKIGDGTNHTQLTGKGSISQAGAARINWTKITADSVTLSVGSTPASLVADLQTHADGNLFHIDEAGGVDPAITLIVDFVSVAAFNWVQIISGYVGGTNHSISIELYNWDTTAWDVFTSQNGIESALTNHSFFAPSDTDYIGTGGDAGKVRVRFNHPFLGNGAHDLDIDVVALYQ